MPRRLRLDSRSRLILILAATVAALALLAWLKPGLKTPDVDTPLLAQAPAATQLRIAPTGATAAELTRAADGWHMTAPLALRADDAAIGDLLQLLAMPADAGFPATGDLSRYGLDRPGIRLTIEGTELDFGGTQPIDQRRYVLLDGRVHLVNPVLFYRLAQNAYDWLDKRLLPEGSEVMAIQLPQATVTRDAQGRWQIAPADKSFDAGALAKLAQDWQQARADNVAAIGRHAVEGEVALSLKGTAAPLRFQIYKDADSLVLARPDLGLQYQLDSADRAVLLLQHAAPRS